VFLYNGVIFNIFHYYLANLTLSQVVNIGTSPCSSSSNNNNLGRLLFSDKLRLIIHKISALIPYAIFPLFYQIREILDGIGVVSIVGTPRSSWKRKVTSEMSLFIAIVTASWSSRTFSPTYETSSIFVSSSKSLRIFVC
jgi:hypothetical protein